MPSDAGLVSLVIFDCDGVLIDSEMIACRAHAAELARHGVPVTLDDLLKRFVGASEATNTAVLRKWRSHLPDDYIDRVRAAMLDGFDRDLTAIPGVYEALAWLPIPACVASNSPMHRLDRCLRKTDLHRCFSPHVFSAEVVGAEKPAPDLHLYAARAMETPPRECLVIEDSVAGIEAARAADMRVIGFSGGSHCRHDHGRHLLDAGADDVFDDMRRLPALLDAFGIKLKSKLDRRAKVIPTSTGTSRP